MSETSKHRPLTVPYCNGNGVDVGSGGDPVVPWAISLELPAAEFARYNAGHEPWGPVQWRGHAHDLPFKDGTLDFVYSSHVLEDFLDWWPLLIEWARVLKPGGFLVILIPDRERWAAAIARGQPPNCEHRHEGTLGELTGYCGRLGLHPILDRFAIPEDATDYSLAFVGQKL